jgi:radical SAM protein with 4Fe4S-binding SPASM domain
MFQNFESVKSRFVIMYVKQSSTVLFRNYDSFGYVTDNRNFGYRKANENEEYIGDKILSKSGAVFFSVLDRKPQSLDSLARKISKMFAGVDAEDIKADAKEFYNILECDGFVFCGNDQQSCEDKDVCFSYKSLENNTINEGLYQTNINPKVSTDFFLEKYFGGQPQLTSLHIEITSECNERCLHCYIPHEYKISSIDSELFYRVVRQCRDMNILNLTLSGGEPLLHKDFYSFLKICREYDFSVNVLSNLTLLNDKIIDEMKLNPLLCVQVSLYSMDPEIHDSITQINGSFEETKKGILALVKNDIPLQISCPIMKQNKNSYKDVVEWAIERNIHVGDYYGILARYNHTTSNLSCRLSIDEVKELVKSKFEDDPNYFSRLEAEVESKKNIMPNDFVCSVCSSSLCMTDNGNVYPCAGWHDFVVGNVKENSLMEIWGKSEKIRYLRGLRNRDFPKCVDCADREFCTICMVRNATESPTGDPFDVNDYFCSITKLNKKLMLEWKGLKS